MTTKRMHTTNQISDHNHTIIVSNNSLAVLICLKQKVISSINWEQTSFL